MIGPSCLRYALDDALNDWIHHVWGALDEGDVNDWAPSRLGAALADDDVNDWAHHVWGGAALDDDEENGWAITFGGLRLMMQMFGPVTTSFGQYA